MDRREFIKSTFALAGWIGIVNIGVPLLEAEKVLGFEFNGGRQPSSSCASDSIDVDQFGNQDTSQGASSHAYGQSFEVTQNGTLSAISLEFQTYSGNATVRWGTSADLTTYEAEATMDVNESSEKFVFATKGSVSTSTTYYFGLIENSGTVVFYLSSSDVYGDYYYDASTTWNMSYVAALCMSFRVYLCD